MSSAFDPTKFTKMLFSRDNEQSDVPHLDQAVFEEKWLKAYLTLPTTYAIMKRSRVPGATAFHATMVVHLSTRRAHLKKQNTFSARQ